MTLTEREGRGYDIGSRGRGGRREREGSRGKEVMGDREKRGGGGG